jgi:hypothetical protein
MSPLKREAAAILSILTYRANGSRARFVCTLLFNFFQAQQSHFIKNLPPDNPFNYFPDTSYFDRLDSLNFSSVDRERFDGERQAEHVSRGAFSSGQRLQGGERETGRHLLHPQPHPLHRAQVPRRRPRHLHQRSHPPQTQTVMQFHFFFFFSNPINKKLSLLPTLSNKDLISFLKVENGAGMHSLVDMVVEGEEDLDATVLQMADLTGASASFLSKDVETLGVELRAEGTGAVCQQPDNSFVSIMDKMAASVLDGPFGGSVF